MNLVGLALLERRVSPRGVVDYRLALDPDLMANPPMMPDPWRNHLYGLAVHGLVADNLAEIRREYPLLYLFTTDYPRGEPGAKKHQDYCSGLLDRAFMGRYPHRTLHVDYGRYGQFQRGPGIHSLLFDITWGTSCTSGMGS